MLDLAGALWQMGEREEAMGLPEGERPIDIGAPKDGLTRAMLSGFDIDFDELDVVLKQVHEAGGSRGSGFFLHGLVVGLYAARKGDEAEG